MPETPTYRVACPTCAYESRPRAGRRFAVLVTDADEDARRRAGEAVPVVLHPLTDYVLDEFGLSFASAGWGGRLVAVRGCVCGGCGRTVDVCRLTAGGVRVGCGGCLGVAGGGVLVAMVVGSLVANPFLGLGAGAIAAVVVLAVVELGAGAIVRGRYARRTRAVDGPTDCPHCGDRDLRPLDGRPGRPPCPQCGAAARVEAVP